MDLRNEITQIVYVSALEEYAIQLFQNRPMDFLIKPIKQEDIDKMREFIFILLKKEKIDPDKLHQHLKYLIIDEVVLWCIFIIYLFVSRSTAI